IFCRGGRTMRPVELLARAADLIEEREGLLGLILCGPGEESLARDLEAKRCEETPSTAAAPLPLDLLKVALERAEFLITTDTGPRHIATALGTPVVVLMGPTDPRYSASNLERTVVLRRDVPCGPCHRKACPFDHHRCLREIPPEEVAEAASRLHAAGRETARRSGRPGELDSSAGTGFRAGC
ncbi:MAG: glycosyltransferase family 9 protein, partial [Planctomycetota bacterium]